MILLLEKSNLNVIKRSSNKITNKITQMKSIIIVTNFKIKVGKKIFGKIT